VSAGRSGRRRTGAGLLARLLVLLAGLAAVGVALAPAASAHAVLVSSSPVDGSRVDSEPSVVRLTFDETVGLIAADEQVISTTGLRADTGQVQQTDGGTTIVLPLKPHLPPGTYSATWRVVSADTHIVSGSITFGFGVNPGAGPAVPASHTGQLDVAANTALGLIYAGIVLLVGAAAAARLLWPWSRGRHRVRGLGWAGWGLMLAGTGVLFLLQGPRGVNGSWGAVFALRGAGQTLGSAFGRQLLARLCLLLAVIPLLMARRLNRPVSGGDDLVRGLTGLAILVSVAVTGHEGAGSDVALALPAATLHLAAMSVWLGGLTLLGAVILPSVRHGERTGPELRLRRWSLMAYGCVVALVVSGEYQASRQLSPVQALWSTRYGVVLLIKAGLVGVMLIAAYLAQRRVAGPAAQTAATADAIHAVRRSVLVETAVALMVVAVTAILVSEPPGRATYGPPATLAAPLGADRVTVRVASTRRGLEEITIRIVSADGTPVPAQSVTGTLSSAQVAALRVTMRKLTPDGSEWRSSAAVVPLPGVWTLSLDVALSASNAYTTSASYQVW